jgi:N-acetylmuramoyl-L-alanine amidase
VRFTENKAVWDRPGDIPGGAKVIYRLPVGTTASVISATTAFGAIWVNIAFDIPGTTDRRTGWVHNAGLEPVGEMPRKKITLDAGHGLHTGGKRTLDGANGVVREWTLNNNVCNNVADILRSYNVDIIRVDDITGATDVSLSDRAKRINEVRPDLSISIHHNGSPGALLTIPNPPSPDLWSNATGVEVFSHPNRPYADLAKRLVDRMSQITGLRNRGAKTADFQTLREVNADIPYVYAEGGFMDSIIDYPIITSQAGQRQYAQAVADFCISALGL